MTRAAGAYYTPDDMARLLVRWAVTPGTRRVLEPSFGAGAFLRGLARLPVDVLGVELDAEVRQRAITDGLLTAARAVHADFLDVPPTPVDAVVGNPPFVPLRQLPEPRAGTAQRRATAALGVPMPLTGSLWLPFLVHAGNFLAPGGRLAFVLPFEVTHVRYARGIWAYLAARFGEVRVVRLRERVFDGIMQDVVLLLCAEHGGRSTEIGFTAYRSLRAFAEDRPVADERIPVADAAGGGKPFTRALLPADLRALLADGLGDRLVPLADLARFRVGYVSGDKDFFHPSDEAISRHRLRAGGHLVPSLTRTRDLRHTGLYSADLPTRELFLLPPDAQPSEDEAGYLAAGAAAGVPRRYKCRVRTPWWSVPGVRRPDLVLSVFSATPRLLVNNGGRTASNSMLCGHLVSTVDFPAAALATAWYTSLTLLECELNVHALGGGVLILIPGEVARIRLPGKGITVDEGHLAHLDDTLRRHGPAAAYRLGDHTVLPTLGITKSTVDTIRTGTETLATWRVPN